MHAHSPGNDPHHPGDVERKVVVCLSLGAPSTLRYHWRLPHSSEHTLPAVDVCLSHGDVYVMSEKATGYDWKMRSKVRLVHGAGAAKYIDPAGKKHKGGGSGPARVTTGGPTGGRRSTKRKR